MALKSGEWFFLFGILDRLSHQAIHLNNCSEIPRSPLFAILGPSHNYEPPVYTLDDGTVVTADEIVGLREIAEAFTVEINWQDGDVAVIDNMRVMHGGRAIKDQDRQLFIGMGRL